MSYVFSDLGMGIIIDNKVGLDCDVVRFSELLVNEFSDGQLELTLGRVMLIEIDSGEEDFKADEGYDPILVTFSFKNRHVTYYGTTRESLIDVYVSYKSLDDFVVKLINEWEIDT